MKPARQGVFDPEERRLLLLAPGIGPGVLRGLEAAGYASLSEMVDAGPDAVVARLCACERSLVWRNRARAIARALRRIGGATPAVSRADRQHRQPASTR